MMNATHLYLLLKHFPVIDLTITTIILIIVILKKSDDIKKTGAMIILLTSLITIPVYFSGEDAQAMIEGNFDDVDEEFIEPHEDFAFYSFIAMDIAGLLALASLLRFRNQNSFPNSVTYTLLILLIIVNGMMAYTANLGGKIHHPEIREDKLPWESTANSGRDNNNDNKSGKENEKDENEKEDD